MHAGHSRLLSSMAICKHSLQPTEPHHRPGWREWATRWLLKKSKRYSHPNAHAAVALYPKRRDSHKINNTEERADIVPALETHRVNGTHRSACIMSPQSICAHNNLSWGSNGKTYTCRQVHGACNAGSSSSHVTHDWHSLADHESCLQNTRGGHGDKHKCTNATRHEKLKPSFIRLQLCFRGNKTQHPENNAARKGPTLIWLHKPRLQPLVLLAGGCQVNDVLDVCPFW